MSRKCKDPHDPDQKSICDILANYEQAHPKARIDIYRQSSVALRIRIIDPDFQGKDLVDRDSETWEIR